MKSICPNTFQTMIDETIQLVDVYEFPLLESHKTIPFMEQIIGKEPLQFHWQNTNKLHEKYAHPFFKNVLGFRKLIFSFVQKTLV